MKQFLSGGSNKEEHRKEPKLTADDTKGKDSGFSMLDGYLIIFRGSATYDSKCLQKLAGHEVYMTEPGVPSFI